MATLKVAFWFIFGYSTVAGESIGFTDHASLDTRQCVETVTIDHPVVEASLAAVGNLILIRARIGSDLAAAKRFVGSSQGLQWLVMDGGNETDSYNQDSSLLACLDGSLFRGFYSRDGSPQEIKNTATRARVPKTSEVCNPTSHQQTPWLCEAGDWTGKFGPLQLGYYSRNLRMGANINDVGTDEIRVHSDEMAIPTCALEGKYLGIYSGGLDGLLLACEPFKRMRSSSEAVSTSLEQALRFVMRFPRQRPCPRYSPGQVADRDWGDKLVDEFKRIPGVMSGWWEEIKSTGGKALNGSTFWS